MDDPDRKKPPRTAPPEVRRRQLIDATITCIARHGISGTTLTAVTKEAGLSLGLANFHFKSKDALLTATLDFLADEHRTLFMRSLPRADLTAAQKLRAIVEAQFHPKVCSRKKLSVWFAFFGGTEHRESYRRSTARIDFERHGTTADLARRIIAEGGYAGVDPARVSQMLEALFDGFWLNMLIYPESFTRTAARRDVFGYLATVFPDHFDAEP